VKKAAAALTEAGRAVCGAVAGGRLCYTMGVACPGPPTRFASHG
jgi:hypothetical protein